jgi:cyclase
VNTHWHGDHTHGNAVYLARFPEIQIVGTPENAAYIDLMQQRFGPLYTREASAPRKELARLRHIQDAGADSAGRPLSAADGALLVRVIGELQGALHEFAGLRVAKPTLLFERELTLDLGGVSARLTSRGRGNSPDDITISVDREGVLFAGDLVVYPVPFAFGVYPTRWVEVLRQIESEPIRVLVPGHGPVMHDLKYVTQVRGLMEAVLARVRALMVTGAPLADILQQIRLEDLEATFVSPSIFNSGPWWRDSVVGALVERSFKCLQGSEC